MLLAAVGCLHCPTGDGEELEDEFIHDMRHCRTMRVIGRRLCFKSVRFVDQQGKVWFIEVLSEGL